jgi:hypothetical protein
MRLRCRYFGTAPTRRQALVVTGHGIDPLLRAFTVVGALQQ